MQKIYSDREGAVDQDVSQAERYPSAHARPSLGFVLEIDGEFASEYATLMAALKAGFELRRRFPNTQVKLHEASEQRQWQPEKSAARRNDSV